jgi:hypothetical protein
VQEPCQVRDNSLFFLFRTNILHEIKNIFNAIFKIVICHAFFLDFLQKMGLFYPLFWDRMIRRLARLFAPAFFPLFTLRAKHDTLGA